MPRVDEVLEQRGPVHGSFVQNAQITQQIKELLRGQAQWRELPMYQQQALDMMALKMARILSGDNNDPEHWIDLAGYAELVRSHLARWKPDATKAD